MNIETIDSGSSEKEPVKTAREYFERQEGTPYIVKNETDDTIEIEIRPGLLGRVIAAGVAVEKEKVVSFELQDKLTVAPKEAKDILRKSIDDILDGK